MAEIIHRKKLFDGRETAKQVHAELAWWGLRCSACGGPPEIRAQSWALLSDLSEDQRTIAMSEVKAGRASFVRLSKGDAVRVGDMVACYLHARNLERAAARLPSYLMVEIDRGPGPDNPVVGVL